MSTYSFERHFSTDVDTQDIYAAQNSYKMKEYIPCKVVHIFVTFYDMRNSFVKCFNIQNA